MRKLSAMTIAVVCMCGLAACGETVNIGDGGIAQGVTVQASGTADVVPNAVRVSLSVSVLAESNQAALSSASSTSATIRATLADLKIDDADFSTQTLTVNPEYSYTEAEGQKVIGYRATQVYDILIRDAVTAGSVIDELVSRGGANVSINSTQPIVDDATSAAEAAREDAVKKAREKAQAYADLLDVELGEVVYLTEVAAPTNVVVGAKADAMAENVATVVDLGTQEVTVTVEVRWKTK